MPYSIGIISKSDFSNQGRHFRDVSDDHLVIFRDGVSGTIFQNSKYLTLLTFKSGTAFQGRNCKCLKLLHLAHYFSGTTFRDVDLEFFITMRKDTILSSLIFTSLKYRPWSVSVPEHYIKSSLVFCLSLKREYVYV